MKVAVTDVSEALLGLFTDVGVKHDDAEIIVKCLVGAELAGVYTHGVRMAADHVRKFETTYNKTGELTIEKATASFTVCDANNMNGMLSAWKAMEIAIGKASETGLHAVFCHNANTLSAAYLYANQAVEKGMIGIVFCNSPAQMAPFGGKEKMLGTNPLAIGIPSKNEHPFILDMATSAVAKSKINQAFFNGEEKIPFGWATDNEGIPTDDPKEAVKGMILPMAGPKGYGLAMAIDIISGLLSHAAYLDQVGRFYSKDNAGMNVGHVFMVLDPVMIYGEDFFYDMDLYLKRVRESKSATDKPVLIPGDINRICEEEIYEKGINLPEKELNDLNQLLTKYGRTQLKWIE